MAATIIRTPQLFATVMLEWQDERGRYHEAEVEVDYTYDGETLKIGKLHIVGNTDSMDDDDLDNQVWEGVEAVCDEAYAEWLAEYGEWLSDQAQDRRDAA